MQIKIFEYNGNNEKEVNEWLKENPKVKVINTNMIPMFDRYVNSGDICNQWIATIITYSE